MDKPRLPDAIEWPESTIEWYEAWRCSPVTDLWDPRQWQYMFDTALVHAEVWGSLNFSMLGELRQRQASMGLVFELSKNPQRAEARMTPLDEIKKRRASKNRKPGAKNKKGT